MTTHLLHAALGYVREALDHLRRVRGYSIAGETPNQLSVTHAKGDGIVVWPAALFYAPPIEAILVVLHKGSRLKIGKRVAHRRRRPLPDRDILRRDGVGPVSVHPDHKEPISLGSRTELARIPYLRIADIVDVGDQPDSCFEFADVFGIRSPRTFSMTKKRGCTSRTKRKKCHSNLRRTSVISRRPISLKPWHGGPPKIPSTGPPASRSSRSDVSFETS